MTTDRDLHDAIADANRGTWVPAFDSVLSPRRPRNRRRTSATLMWAAAAGLAVATILGVLVSRRSTLEVPQEVMALSRWTPMTDALLRSANASISTEPPRFDAAILGSPVLRD